MPNSAAGPGRPLLVMAVIAALAACQAPGPSASPAPVTLRLQVSLTPQELESFRPALQAVDGAHPGWTVSLEPVPQEAEVERVTNALAGEPPDVLRLQGLNVQQWIRREAFLDLSGRLDRETVEAEFYGGPLEQFSWRDALWGVPDLASPEVVYFNTEMFDAAGLDYPTADWTFDDMRAAAIRLTLDGAGRTPADPAFDPATTRQWGWNGGLTYFWQNAFVQALGGDLCANDDCTEMSFTHPETAAAIEWWVTLVRDDHAALYDPYGGSQTGVPGDPFLAGVAAMGSNGAFAIGQLNDAATIEYDIVPPFLGVDGERHTPLSTTGYVIAATSEHPDAAWELVQALTATDFLAATWGRPGHGVPARIAAAESVVDASHPPANQAAILEAMPAGRVFRPFTASAFAAFGATVDLFRQMNTGELGIADGLTQLEAAANAALEPDREAP